MSCTLKNKSSRQGFFRSSAIEEHFFFYEKFESFHGTIMPIKKSCFLEYDIGYTKEKF